MISEKSSDGRRLHYIVKSKSNEYTLCETSGRWQCLEFAILESVCWQSVECNSKKSTQQTPTIQQKDALDSGGRAKRVSLRQQILDTYGRTAGCAGCLGIWQHTKECLARIEKEMVGKVMQFKLSPVKKLWKSQERRAQWQTHPRRENLSKDPVRMRVHWRVVSRQSTTFCVTCQLLTSAEIELHWVKNSRKMNWRPVENSSCKTCWILTHLNWWMSWFQESTLTTCSRERQTRFSSSICWQKQRVARTLESLSSTFLLHSCTLEQTRKFYVKVPSGIVMVR